MIFEEEGGKKWDQQPAGFTHGPILPSAGKGILVQERQVQNCSYGKPQVLLWLKAQISFRVFPGLQKIDTDLIVMSRLEACCCCIHFHPELEFICLEKEDSTA